MRESTVTRENTKSRLAVPAGPDGLEVPEQEVVNLFPDGTTVPERGTAQNGEKEMFLAKLLIGNSIMMDRDLSHARATECRNLIVPPIDPGILTNHLIAIPDATLCSVPPQ